MNKPRGNFTSPYGANWMNTPIASPVLRKNFTPSVR